MPSSGVKPMVLMNQPVTYAALPKKAACPNESRPVKPSSRLNAQANRAKHSSFITNTGYRPITGASNASASSAR